ncbi:carboxypeptidase regulatory-like domain-containing protein [Thermodesulfobacteriota bacterium]
MLKQTVAAVLCAILLAVPAAAFTPGSVSVSVRDYDDNTTLGDALVTMEPGGYSGTTDAEGLVSFEGVTPYRNYGVDVALEGYAGGRFGAGRTGYVAVAAGQPTRVTIPLRKQASISGVITSGGEALEGAFVMVMQEASGEDEGLEYVAASRSGNDGSYSITPMGGGDYTLIAVADSYYETREDIALAAAEDLVMDFDLRRGVTLARYDLVVGDTYYGNSVLIIPSNLRLFLFNDRVFDIIEMPEGARILDRGKSTFVPDMPGDYTVAMMVIDSKGVGREVQQTLTLQNHPAEAYPSVIPGPSELPLLYDNATSPTSRGTVTVEAGEQVYLRGWGRDFNLSSPELFNPDAAEFDIYGNKNGDWGQSAFAFAWSLQDDAGADRSQMLSAADTRNVSFTVPADAAPGDIFTASLTVTGDAGLAGDPGTVSVVVADAVGIETCGGCHKERYAAYQKTLHYDRGVGCEDCHGPGSQHNGDPQRITVSHWPGVCGGCHEEFAQWQKSRHSDPLAFGHAEIGIPRISECYKCHYTDGYIAAVESGDFASFDHPMFAEAPQDTPNISCDSCHDPHAVLDDGAVGIRTGSSASLCGTCHEKKWQNATYLAKGDEIGNAYHWNDYSAYQGSGNPHSMPGGCVTCHMATDAGDSDTLGVRLVGGHGLRMRDVGADGNPGTADDVLNIDVCRNCHGGLESFDNNGVTSRIKTKLEQLAGALRTVNRDYLPPNQPGKCATCHRGGTLPFINDSADRVLDKAYTNYKLVANDRSLGVHNPGYIERLVDDSIAAVQRLEQLRITELAAAAGNRQVTISWTTAAEDDVAGFNLYRAGADGGYSMINTATIDATGAGSAYSYTDQNLQNRTSYSYLLEDVSGSGATLRHGPVTATPGRSR